MNVEEIKEALSKNIKFLVSNDIANMEQWGERFNLNKGKVSSYVRRIALMPVDIALEVCHTYGISLEDFYTKDLSNLSGFKIRTLKLISDNKSAVKSIQDEENEYSNLNIIQLIEKVTQLNR
ncbi:MAG: hypothetical protein ACJAZV_000839 [Roseivirga sp.]|jgi:hypothetical protein